MKKYDHLFFDLDNTLWDFDTNSRIALFETLNELGIPNKQVPHDDFYKKYKTINDSLWEDYRNKKISKSELIKTRFQKTFNHFGINSIDPVFMNEAYLKNMANQTKLVDGAVEILEQLKAKGYQMHIITNGFTEVQNNKISKSGLKKYFNNVFTSEEVKVPKPDKRIFQHALKNCNAKKRKSLMVGDSWDVDIIGAKNLKIDQVFFNRNNDLEPNFSQIISDNSSISNDTKTYFISNLVELETII